MNGGVKEVWDWEWIISYKRFATELDRRIFARMNRDCIEFRISFRDFILLSEGFWWVDCRMIGQLKSKCLIDRELPHLQWMFLTNLVFKEFNHNLTFRE